MAKRNGKKGENIKVDLAGRIPNPFCPQTKRARPAAVRGLQRAERHYNPEPIPTPTDAGITGPSPRRPLVHKGGPKNRV